MDKYKIGIFIDAFYPMVDGVITVVDNLARTLKDRLDITVFTVKMSGEAEDTIEHPYKVVRSKSRPLGSLDYDLPMPFFDKNFKKELKNSKLDLVYCHSPTYMAGAGLKYAKKHHIPSLCHLHSQYKYDIYKVAHSKLITKIVLKSFLKNFNKCDYAIAVNEYTRALFKNEYKLKPSITVVQNATDMTPVLDTEKACRIVNEKFGFSPDEKIFLYVGRLNKLKNIDFILESLQILKNDFQNFKFLIVGCGNDEEHFKEKTKELGLDDYVVFAGKIIDKELLKNIYARSDLFLFPSKYDTDGLVKFEAASQGTPTVLLENTGAASAIVNNETGYISKDDKNMYAKRILDALTDKELYSKISANARTKLYRTWENSADEIYNIIVSMIEQNKKAKEKGK